MMMMMMMIIIIIIITINRKRQRQNSCNNFSPRDVVCLGNMCMDTLHKGDDGDNNDDDDEDDDDSNNNNKLRASKFVSVFIKLFISYLPVNHPFLYHFILWTDLFHLSCY